MEKECESKKKNLQVEQLELIDISSADDFLIASSVFDSLEDLRLSISLDNPSMHEECKSRQSLEVDNATKILYQRVQKLPPSESSEPARPSYMRKSLAWDSAFLTSTGVLDSNELFIINEGLMASEALTPPARVDIRERRPPVLESALGRDSFSLESLEFDLFEDVRASQKELNVAKPSLPASKKVGVGSRKRCTARAEKSCTPTLKGGEIYSVPKRQNKRASFGAYDTQIKSKTAKTESGKFVAVSKKFGPKELCSLAPSTTVPSKTSSSVLKSSSKWSTVSISHISSNETSASASSSRFSSGSLRRKTNSKSIKQVTTGPIRRKSDIGRSVLSAPISPLSNIASITSLASSVDRQSSESLTLTSSANLGSDTIKASATMSMLHEISPHFQEIQDSRLSRNHNVKETRRTDLNSAKSTRNSRPSGLRMPSPKIGFFDKERAMEHTVKETSQFHSEGQVNSPKVGVLTSRECLGKQQATRPSKEAGGLKLDSHQNGILNPDSNITPRSSLKFERLCSNKVSSTFQTMRGPLATGSKASTDIVLEVKPRKIDPGHDKGKAGPTSSLKKEGKRTKGQHNTEMVTDSEGSKDNIGISKAINQLENLPEEAGQRDLKNNQHVHQEKSNFEDQVNRLSKYFEVIDLGSDVVIEFNGKNGFPGNPVTPRFSPSEGKHLSCDQQQDSSGALSKPTLLPNLTTEEFLPSARTPLADKTSMCNNETINLSSEMAREKVGTKGINVASFRSC